MYTIALMFFAYSYFKYGTYNTRAEVSLHFFKFIKKLQPKHFSLYWKLIRNT